MGVTVTNFGQIGDDRVKQFTLASDTGVALDFISYGGILRDWRVPVAGGTRSVVLGFDRLEDYVAHSPYFGALVGRVANRIAGASFMRDGQRVELTPNEGANQLHGGPEGFSRQVWTAEADSTANAVRFSLRSRAGAMGYPGNLEVAATYTLTGNALRLEFSAMTDERTPISLVQHHYFNLGTGPDVLDHRFQIEAGAYTETGPDLILTGNILEIPADSERNLRGGRTLRDAAGQPMDFDGNLVLDAGRDFSKPVATITAPDEALTLTLRTDQPGLQFYNAVMTNVPVPGLGGRRYGRYSGFCIEDQAFPDALHHPHFPSIWHEPGRDYSHWCEITIA